tara:strand:+ start:2813 stop:3010 length:198 start_codon:yes stop_codon:yes gene_type:complete
MNTIKTGKINGYAISITCNGLASGGILRVGVSIGGIARWYPRSASDHTAASAVADVASHYNFDGE